MQIITDFILTILLEIYKLTNNLGWSIVVFTVLVRGILLPLSFKSMSAQKKMKELQPKIKELEKNHSGSKEDLQKAKLELFKKYNVNPLAGCLPQLVQIGLFIVLYQVLISFLGQTSIHGQTINQVFYWLNLSKPDQLFILPVLAGLTQLILSVMILPGGEVADVVPNQSKLAKVKAANKKEENVAEMAESMQKQMLFIMPVMTVVIALKFPSGLALYWIATTIFSIGQQYFLSGWGGLTLYLKRIKLLFAQKS
jgi:YidC/Oxa1 family membrane protein insertase